MILALCSVVGLTLFGAGLGWWAGGPFATRSERLDPTSPVRATVVAYVLFHVVGAVGLLVTGESDGSGPLLASGALAAFGAGAAAVRLVRGPTHRLEPPRAEGLSVVGIAAMAGIGLIAAGSLVVRFGLPLVSPDPVLSRAGFAGLALDLFRWLVPAAAVALAALAFARRSQRDAWTAGAAVIGVAGLEVLFASRALPAELALEVLLVGYWAGTRFSRRGWLGLATAAIALFIGIQLVRVAPQGLFDNAAEAVEFAARRTVDRVLLIHPRTLEVIATTIPEDEPFFGGSTYVRRFAIVLGQDERPSLGFWLYERLFPGETGGFAAPSVAGEAWANGGPILVVLVMAGLGALATWLGRVLGRLPGGPADRALAAIVVVAFARTYATSLNGFLLTLVVSAAWWLVASGRLGRVFGR